MRFLRRYPLVFVAMAVGGLFLVDCQTALAQRSMRRRGARATETPAVQTPAAQAPSTQLTAPATPMQAAVSAQPVVSTPAAASEPSTPEAADLIAKAPPLMEGLFTTSDGLKIHYLEQGKGPDVVLVHGFTSSARQNWYQNGNMAALAVNHHVVAIDCRNHGESDKPTPRGSGKAQDVIELMDHLKIAKAHIAGYSMGGAETSALLGSNPERFISATFAGSAPGARLDLTQLNIPIMVINGEQDGGLTRGARVEKDVKDHKVVSVPGRGHMNAPSHPVFIASMVEWINAHDPKK